ncbi:recombinase family protein [Micromonospora sp. STR1_7]|uniref:Recombinase family protein n=1 Tax=Micromonospora parastrephiae TaxID=2806101 RepID=A0ABS1XVV8_9ACTN|nr:recombinase family protein [Micromonospora parastrephiae]MBM0233373.1 recombinase family protein [Micromonospora parastrephiae]
MRLAAIYERISDDREGRELGVDRQDKDCQALTRREGLTVFGVYRDNDISASTNSRKPRPEYDRLIADAKAGKFSVIVAYTSGRLTRRPREHEDLIDLATGYGISYRYVRSPNFDLNTAQGREIARTMAARDAGEAEEIAERVAAEVRDRAERGEYHGGPRSYGLAPNGRDLVESEAAEIRRWYAHVLAGGSLAGLQADLNRRGIPTATGRTWRAPVIRKILLKPRNAGLRILHGIEYAAPNPPIVAESTWRAVRQILEEPGRLANHTGTARRHVGTGLFICERCDPRTVNATYDRSGNLLYRCLLCFRSWRAEPIHRWLNATVEAILAKEDDRKRLLPAPAKGIDLRGLWSEAAAIQGNLAELAAEFALSRGAVKAALKSGMDRGQERLDEIQVEITAAGRVDATTALLAADDPVAAYRAISDVGLRQAVLRSIAVIRLGPPIRGRAEWDATKFMGGSQWKNDTRTWGEIWAEAGL